MDSTKLNDWLRRGEDLEKEELARDRLQRRATAIDRAFHRAFEELRGMDGTLETGLFTRRSEGKTPLAYFLRFARILRLLGLALKHQGIFPTAPPAIGLFEQLAFETMSRLAFESPPVRAEDAAASIEDHVRTINQKVEGKKVAPNRDSADFPFYLRMEFWDDMRRLAGLQSQRTAKRPDTKKPGRDTVCPNEHRPGDLSATPDSPEPSSRDREIARLAAKLLFDPGHDLGTPAVGEVDSSRAKPAAQTPLSLTTSPASTEAVAQPTWKSLPPKGVPLRGWSAIFDALNATKTRSKKDAFKRANKRMEGPISWPDGRFPEVDLGRLLAWMQDVDGRAAIASATRESDRAVASELAEREGIRARDQKMSIKRNPGR